MSDPVTAAQSLFNEIKDLQVSSASAKVQFNSV